jgi:chitodextrinase
MAWTDEARRAAALKRRKGAKAKSSVTYSDTSYQWAHGKKPRGEGSWAFDVKGSTAKKTVFFKGTYTAAKKQAIDMGKRLRTKYKSVTIKLGS